MPGLVGMHDHLFHIARPNLQGQRQKRRAAARARDGILRAAPLPGGGRDHDPHDRECRAVTRT
jgi:hypothetical protein